MTTLDTYIYTCFLFFIVFFKPFSVFLARNIRINYNDNKERIATETENACITYNITTITLIFLEFPIKILYVKNSNKDQKLYNFCHSYLGHTFLTLTYNTSSLYERIFAVYRYIV